MARPSKQVLPSSDPLGEALHLLQMTGTLYCRAELTAPWGVEVPPLDDVMTFQVVTAGRCWLEIGGAAPRLLQPGSLTLIPHGTRHRMRSSPKAKLEPLFDLPVERINERYEIMRHGGGGDLTHVTYCVLRFDSVAARRLLGLLPEVMHIDAFEDEVGGWLQSTLRLIAREAAALRPGGETVITRLSDVLVVQTIRAWLESAPEAQRGWLAALRDEQLGRALAAIHRDPGRDWSLVELAKEARLSRSAFSERFSRLVGEAPMHYVTDWRMQVARASLQKRAEPLSALASRLGYQSEAAFSRAFRRTFGVSPGSVHRSVAVP